VARLLIRQTTTGEIKEIEEGALPFFANQGWLTIGVGTGYTPPNAAASGATIAIHGDDAGYARPVTAGPVIWYGTVDPANADDTKDVTVYVTADA
jgi:hypothetical protein